MAISVSALSWVNGVARPDAVLVEFRQPVRSTLSGHPIRDSPGDTGRVRDSFSDAPLIHEWFSQFMGGLGGRDSQTVFRPWSEGMAGFNLPAYKYAFAPGPPLVKEAARPVTSLGVDPPRRVRSKNEACAVAPGLPLAREVTLPDAVCVPGSPPVTGADLLVAASCDSFRHVRSGIDACGEGGVDFLLPGNTGDF